MKHTPGPWTKHQHSSKEPFVVEPDNEAAFIAYDSVVGAGEKIVATVSMITANAGYPRVTNKAECDANARLIAAAPELLEALEWAYACYETGAWKNEDGQTPDVDIIRSAIRKAKGE